MSTSSEVERKACAEVWTCRLSVPMPVPCSGVAFLTLRAGCLLIDWTLQQCIAHPSMLTVLPNVLFPLSGICLHKTRVSSPAMLLLGDLVLQTVWKVSCILQWYTVHAEHHSNGSPKRWQHHPREVLSAPRHKPCFCALTLLPEHCWCI